MWRSFDVGAVVDAMSSDAQVVAGVGGLNRQVSRAKTAATPGCCERWVRASSS
ncbi:MAG: hypothetical protein IPN02_12245 [Candidatus Microthrix sp.]|uniref:Uncharacterized protein n=1 Tax=Candidatus Neomicrothrix subdominans TaxID=2954438 RepID=A0A936NEL1_9ACTN|nr:hypothetical protein [Candidatus Microthrix subdominans]